ncbi:phage tail protein [Pectobacteriaceae bacterium C52]|nr:phage tail protein [Serratia sp. ATCC 39006]WJV61046.1 phage tail protein [Pectobacteriaceae bacterium C52]
MAENNFKPFATSAGANVISQADWEVLATLDTGFQGGKASSSQMNKAIRQSSVISSVIAQLIANRTGSDVLDNGDTATILTNLLAALFNSPALTGTPTAPTPAPATNSTQIATTAFVWSELNSSLVGIPLPWPQATAPTGWLKCNGQTFNTALYPMLAMTYPSGTLPDLRGEFIRGWDDGRAVDNGRTLLSQQSHAMQQMTGSVPGVHAQTIGAQFGGLGVLGMNHVDSTIPPAEGGADYGGFVMTFDNNIPGINTSTENRPRNVAFNYIVRAA